MKRSMADNSQIINIVLDNEENNQRCVKLYQFIQDEKCPDTKRDAKQAEWSKAYDHGGLFRPTPGTPIRTIEERINGYKDGAKSTWAKNQILVTSTIRSIRQNQDHKSNTENLLTPSEIKNRF